LFQHVRKNRRSKGDFELDLCSRVAMLTIATPSRCPVSHCSHACGCVARDTSWISVGFADGPAPTMFDQSICLRGNFVRGRGSTWRGGLIPWHAYPCGGLQAIQGHHAHLVAAPSVCVRQVCALPTPRGRALARHGMGVLAQFAQAMLAKLLARCPRARRCAGGQAHQGWPARQTLFDQTERIRVMCQVVSPRIHGELIGWHVSG
jgi:hypothetical protein